MTFFKSEMLKIGGAGANGKRLLFRRVRTARYEY